MSSISKPTTIVYGSTGATNKGNGLPEFKKNNSSISGNTGCCHLMKEEKPLTTIGSITVEKARSKENFMEVESLGGETLKYQLKDSQHDDKAMIFDKASTQESLNARSSQETWNISSARDSSESVGKKSNFVPLSKGIKSKKKP